MTDPQCPRYCMVFFRPPNRDDPDCRCRQPMSARTYVESYHPWIYGGIVPPHWIENPEETEETEENIRASYEGIYGVPLIDRDTLVEAFPREFGDWSTEWKRKHEEVDQIRLGGQVIMSTLPDVTPRLPSLLCITAKIILQALMADTDNSAETIEFFFRVPLDGSTIDILYAELTQHSELPDSTPPFLANLLN